MDYYLSSKSYQLANILAIVYQVLKIQMENHSKECRQAITVFQPISMAEKVLRFANDFIGYKEHAAHLRILKLDIEKKQNVLETHRRNVCRSAIVFAIKKLTSIHESGEEVRFCDAIAQAARYSKRKLEEEIRRLKEEGMIYESASNEHDEYFGKYMFSTEVAAFVAAQREE